MTRQRLDGRSAIASLAIGVTVAALLYATSRTATGNPHRSLGLVLLALQLPGFEIAHALAGGPGFQMQSGEVPILLAVNALAYSSVAYGVFWTIARLPASRTRHPAPTT